jgi:hypothetical protein
MVDAVLCCGDAARCLCALCAQGGQAGQLWPPALVLPECWLSSEWRFVRILLCVGRQHECTVAGGHATWIYALQWISFGIRKAWRCVGAQLLWLVRGRGRDGRTGGEGVVCT